MCSAQVSKHVRGEREQYRVPRAMREARVALAVVTETSISSALAAGSEQRRTIDLS